jgi:hypothetical protein
VTNPAFWRNPKSFGLQQPWRYSPVCACGSPGRRNPRHPRTHAGGRSPSTLRGVEAHDAHSDGADLQSDRPFQHPKIVQLRTQIRAPVAYHQQHAAAQEQPHPRCTDAGVGCGWDGSLADHALSTACLGRMRPRRGPTSRRSPTQALTGVGSAKPREVGVGPIDPGDGRHPPADPFPPSLPGVHPRCTCPRERCAWLGALSCKPPDNERSDGHDAAITRCAFA